MHFAFPDVCKTPTPAGPVPVPYPNIALTSDAVPNVLMQIIQGMPIHNLMTNSLFSSGNEAGVLGGVVSNVIKGPSQYLTGSTKVFASVMPITKMLSTTAQNGVPPNCVGMTITPSQLKVLVLS